MRRQALEWIRELIAAEVASLGVSIVDFEVAHELLVHSSFQQGQVYRLEVRLWERAGLARLEGRRVQFPADLDPWEGKPPPRPPRSAEGPEGSLEDSELRLVSEATRGLRREGVLRCGAWVHDEGGTWIWVDRQAPDGRLAVELDPQTGVRLGTFFPFRARGSRRSAAISRSRAVQEGRARLNIPAEAVQVYTRLCKRPRLRVWNMRWTVGDGPWRGEVRAELNARTARVVESEVRLQPRRAGRSLPAEERGRAESEIRREVLRVIGGAPQIGPLVPGVSESGERPCWLAVVRDSEGSRRVTYCEGKVRLGPSRQAS